MTKKTVRLLIPILGSLLNTVGDAPAQQPMTRQDVESYRNQVQKFWQMPGGISAGPFHVDVKVKLKSDGTVDGTPKILNENQDEDFKKVARSIVRAFVLCQPFKL